MQMLPPLPYEKLRAGDLKGSFFLVARCFFFRQGKVQGNLEAPSSEVLWPQGPAGLPFVFLIFLLRRETGRGPGHGEVAILQGNVLTPMSAKCSVAGRGWEIWGVVWRS